MVELTKVVQFTRIGGTYQVERNDEIDRVTIAFILEIVQDYLENSGGNADDVSRNHPLIEEIHSKVNDFVRRPTV